MTVNVDDRSELETIARIAEQLGRPADICLRVLPFSYADPAALEPELAAIAADTSHDKWGMDRETILEVVPEALDSTWLRLRGLHLHVSRIRATPEAFELASQLIATCIAELHDRFGWQPELLDFGGGYPHERDPESGAPSGSHTVGTPGRVRGGDHVDAADGARRAARSQEPHLLLEPGRRLVSNAPSSSPAWASSSACRPGARRGSTSTRARTTAPGSLFRATTTRSSTRREAGSTGTRRSASSARRA